MTGIEVAATLEREMARVPDFLGNLSKAESKSGISGNVTLWKSQKEQ